MAQTITPVVHGGSRKRWAGSISLHVLGAAMSAAVLGGLLGLAGSFLGAPWGRAGLLLVAAIALAYAAGELLGIRVPILEMRRQVPEWWRGVFGPRVASLLYGIALGPGFFTHLRHGTFVAVSAAAVILGDPVAGVALVMPFGVARALGVALVSSARTVPGALGATDRLERIGSGSAPRWVNAAALIGLAGTALLVTAPSGSPEPWMWPAILAVTFAWAALAKLLRPGTWRSSIRAYRLPLMIERVAERAVPLAELSAAILLLFGPVEASATVALILLSAFSVALLRARSLGSDSLPCGCFGGRARRKVSSLMARNAALSMVALATLLVGAPIPIEAPTGSEVLPAVLVGVGVVLGAWVLRRTADLGNKEDIRALGTK